MARRKPKSETAEPTREPTAAEPILQADIPTTPPANDSNPEAPATSEPDAAGKNYGPNPFGIRSDLVAGVRLQEDKRFRQIQLKFDAKPTEAVRQAVRDAGFQWRSQEQVWSKQIDPDQGWRTRTAAEELFEQVTSLIRTEQGHGNAIG